jgi:hypothetical protein
MEYLTSFTDISSSDIYNCRNLLIVNEDDEKYYDFRQKIDSDFLAVFLIYMLVFLFTSRLVILILDLSIDSAAKFVDGLSMFFTILTIALIYKQNQISNKQVMSQFKQNDFYRSAKLHISTLYVTKNKSDTIYIHCELRNVGMSAAYDIIFEDPPRNLDSSDFSYQQSNVPLRSVYKYYDSLRNKSSIFNHALFPNESLKIVFILEKNIEYVNFCLFYKDGSSEPKKSNEYSINREGIISYPYLSY